MVADPVTSVRLEIYRGFVSGGKPSGVDDVAAGLGMPREQVEASFRELEAGRVLVFEPGTLDVWMANPFSARPTGFRVSTDSGSWWGTCVWDAFGIPAMLGEDGRIETSDPATGEPFELRIEDGRLAPVEAVAHFAVPAGRWWDDIGFT
jgi:Alkylmercury lyase